MRQNYDNYYSLWDLGQQQAEIEFEYVCLAPNKTKTSQKITKINAGY